MKEPAVGNIVRIKFHTGTQLARIEGVSNHDGEPVFRIRKFARGRKEWQKSTYLIELDKIYGEPTPEDIQLLAQYGHRLRGQGTDLSIRQLELLAQVKEAVAIPLWLRQGKKWHMRTMSSLILRGFVRKIFRGHEAQLVLTPEGHAELIRAGRLARSSR